jgi:O-antigen/teichoic acid export membrane protein
VAQGPSDAVGGRRPGLTGWARDAVVVAAGLAVAQVAAYAFTIVAARRMSPDQFGALFALLALVLIANVVALGTQAVAARTLVRSSDAQRPGLAAGLRRTGWQWGAGTAGLLVVVSPLLVGWLHLGLLACWLTAASVALLVVAGSLQGTTQGTTAMTRLALVLAALGLLRAIGGTVAVWVDPTTTAASAGLLTGFAGALCLAWWIAVPRPDRNALTTPPGVHGAIGHASHALLALYVLGNIDVLAARATLAPRLAGAYAVGAVVAKVAFWASQFVVQVAFPAMARASAGPRTTWLAAAAVAAVGALTVTVTAVASNRIVTAIGGDGYLAVAPSLVWFAATGAMVALAQVLLYGRLAHDDRRAAFTVWTGVAVLVLLVAAQTAVSTVTVASLIHSALAAAVLVVVLGAITLRRRHP